MTGRKWPVRIPAPSRIRSVNHMVGSHAAVSAYRKAWRDTAYAKIVDARVPQGLARIRIDIEIRFPTAARRDNANYHPTIAKPIVDACGPERRKRLPRGGVSVARGHGVIADDTADYLCCTDDPHITFGDPVGRDDPRWPHGLVLLTITDLTEATHA